MSNSKEIQKLPSDYAAFLKIIKRHISESRLQAYRAVNKELITLYWNIGEEIAMRQERDGWGKSVVERLSRDLREEFPGTSGFSARNLWYMRCFYVEYKDSPILQQLVAEVPWGHNLLIFNKIKGMSERGYYLKMTMEMCWSRNVLLHQIKTQAHKRHKLAAKQHNFPSIGIILCGDRNRMEVEYSLKGIEKPMGVAEYTLTRKLPSDLVDKLPKPEELERQIMQELGKEEMEGETERVDKKVSRWRRKIQ